MPDRPYREYRFPKEIIAHAVWQYFRFSVSFRDVEKMMAAHGVFVTYETVRCWCDKFGSQFAARLRRRRARTGDKWHLDEVFLKIDGVTITFGEQSIRTALFWTSSYNRSGIGLPRSDSFVSCCGLRDGNRACSYPPPDDGR